MATVATDGGIVPWLSGASGSNGCSAFCMIWTTFAIVTVGMVEP